jgi:8-oxo-dGTP pyrophosphatase MutT (NUDIX family)
VTALLTAEQALRIVLGFNPCGDDLAQKSKELTVGLLLSTDAPFSRNQFTPGHITCTALVRHPRRPQVLFMYHNRLQRWLLPGGHVEVSDEDLATTAAREAEEETLVQIDPETVPRLAGIDVHGIPPKRKRNEPYHLHHDLIWTFTALRDEIAVTDEAASVLWAGQSDWDHLGVAESIRRSILKA